MKTFKHHKSDGSIVETRFIGDRIYTKEYSSLHERNKASDATAMFILKILFAPIYYPVKFMCKITFFLFKGIYWDLPRFIYSKLKK